MHGHCRYVGVSGGTVAKKKYDPLWEIVDEKVALQGQEPDLDAHCPNCNVTLHLGSQPLTGQRVTCGLCGEALEVVSGAGGADLKRLTPTT
jgi:hypothetical protein